MKYDLIVVGMGPSAAFLAYELIEQNNYKNVLLIDQGKSVSKRICPMEKAGKCLNCKPYCNITCGFSGAGAFSDGKLNSYHLSSRDRDGKLYLGGNDGGYIREYMTEDEIIAMIGGIGLGVECVFQNIEDNYEIRVEVASEILNKLQDKYIKSKENIRYWESL